MNTKTLMFSSAVLLAVLGITLTFLPQETAGYLNLESNNITVIFLQIAGAMYIGYALMNWMIKSAAIGGIYNRPAAIANFTQFFVAAIALIKLIAGNPH